MRAVTASPNTMTSSRALSAPGQDRATVYDGLVGKSPYDYEKHGGSETQFDDADPVPEDYVHVISIACGYLGLVAGFGVVVTTIW